VHPHTSPRIFSLPFHDCLILNTQSLSRWQLEWFGNIRADILAGLVVALALIPEAIAFSIIAGVDPKVGLYASFSIAVIVAITGAARSLFRMTGFVNALAILIFMAQLPELIGIPNPGLTYAMVAAGLAIIYLLPRLTSVVPSPLVCIIILTAISLAVGLDVRTVGDMGELPDSLPIFLLPDIPLTFETFMIILPYSVAVAAVGLLESLMTASIVDELTDTRSDKNRECIGQGIANTATGFIGGMAGCAMIGQSIINVKSGGRGRLSTFCAGIFLLLMIVFLGDWVKQIPMPALVAIILPSIRR